MARFVLFLQGRLSGFAWSRALKFENIFQNFTNLPFAWNSHLKRSLAAQQSKIEKKPSYNKLAYCKYNIHYYYQNVIVMISKHCLTLSPRKSYKNKNISVISVNKPIYTKAHIRDTYCETWKWDKSTQRKEKHEIK